MRRCGFLFWLSLLLVTQVAAVPLSARDVAVRESEAFLALLDQQRYTEAWQVGTFYFQSRLTLQEWKRILKAQREPLGRVKARRMLSARHIDSFDAAPPGIYMQVEFRSSFAREEQRELLVIQKDADGRWRIASYQLR